MGLREEFEQQGDWLFRWRSYIPLVLIPFAAIAVAFLSTGSIGIVLWNSWIYKGACFGISVAGLIVRCLIIGYVPAGTSGRNTKEQKADSLNTKGIYSLVRHPLYLGNYLMFLGIVLYIPLAWFAIIFSLLYWIYYERIMFREEEFIRGKYGDTFVAWSKKTPAFIPRFSGYKKPALSFSFVNVLRREYSGFYAMVTMFVVVHMGIMWRITGVYVFERWWFLAWVCATGIYITLRTLKKKTQVLRVDGR